VLSCVDDIMVIATTILRRSGLTRTVKGIAESRKLGGGGGYQLPITFRTSALMLPDREYRSARINQSGYIAKVSEQVNVTDCRPRDTPMEEGVKLSATQTGESVT
jgi:hypothetical protein